jgi:hypothetical protein
MSPTLKEHIQRQPTSCWKPYRSDAEAESECADVLNYWPEAEEEKAFGPLRWVAFLRTDYGYGQSEWGWHVLPPRGGAMLL